MKRFLIPLALLFTAIPSSSAFAQDNFPSQQVAYDVGHFEGHLKAICIATNLFGTKYPKDANTFFDSMSFLGYTNEPSFAPIKQAVIPVIKQHWADMKAKMTSQDVALANGYQNCIDRLDAKTRGY